MNRPLRALVLTADHPPHTWSGIGAAVAAQAAALAGLGIDVTVALPEPHPSHTATRTAGGPALRPLRARRCDLRPWEFDVVHLHSLGLSELALEIRRRFGVSVVYTAHSLLHRELEGHPAQPGWARVQAAVMRACDHVVFLSRPERDEAVARCPEVGPTSSVRPNGVAPPPSPLPPAPAHPAPLVFAGRFTRSKGIDLLARVVRLLAPHPLLRFVLAGGHGDRAGEAIVSQLAADHPRTCRAVGWLDQEALGALFAGAALVLVPSRYEPHGMSALEALRLGTPVLAADVGGLADVVAPGGGLLVGSHDPGDWCRAILGLWHAPATRAELRRRGPPAVARHHDATARARALATEVYAPLAARTGRARTGRGRETGVA